MLVIGTGGPRKIINARIILKKYACIFSGVIMEYGGVSFDRIMAPLRTVYWVLMMGTTLLRAYLLILF